MGRSRRKLVAPTLLVLLVVSGILLMHGFDSVSPETLATHTQHDADDADATATVAGICVFVIAMVATAAVNLATSATLPVAVRPHARGWTLKRMAGRKPAQSSFYELCVMRV
jgi:Na+/H+ antiporter NhaD/arsenite permease-like protein